MSCVVFDHLAGLWGEHVRWVDLGTIGHVGVTLFFVHTTLVLMSSLERLAQRAPGWGVWSARFYVRRLFRIYPLAMAVVLAAWALDLPRTAGHLSHPPVFEALTAREWAANFALVQNLVPGVRLALNPLWTLPVELQMYLLLPLVYLVARRGARPALLLLAASIGLGLSVWRSDAEWLQVVRFAPCFMAGALAWALCRRPGERRPLGAPAAIALSAALLLAFALAWPSHDVARRWWLLAIAVALLIPRLPELRDGAVARAASAIATHSYGIYLLHVPLLYLAFFGLGALPVWVRAAAFAIGLAMASALTYRFIERPGIALGVRLAARVGAA